MKILIPLFLVSAILSGCSYVQDTKEIKVKTEVDHKTVVNTEQNRAKSLTDVYVPNPQVPDDSKLLKVGQTLSDDKGKETLVGMAALNQTFTFGSVEMKIKNVKLIQNSPTYSLMDYFHYYTENYEDFKFVKLEVEIVNKSNEKVHFGPVAHMKTSNNEERAFKDDFYIEYLGGEIEANGSKQGALGFIVEKSSPNLNWIEITTSDVLDQKHNVISKAQKIKINFN
jgi:Domain of unknown function (DUF4352)